MLIRIRLARFLLAILIVFVFFFAAENFDSRSFHPSSHHSVLPSSHPRIIDTFFPFRFKQQRIVLLKNLLVSLIFASIFIIKISSKFNLLHKKVYDRNILRTRRLTLLCTKFRERKPRRTVAKKILVFLQALEHTHPYFCNNEVNANNTCQINDL